MLVRNRRMAGCIASRSKHAAVLHPLPCSRSCRFCYASITWAAPPHVVVTPVQMMVDVIGVVTEVKPLGSVKRKTDQVELSRRDITLVDQGCARVAGRECKQRCYGSVGLSLAAQLPLRLTRVLCVSLVSHALDRAAASKLWWSRSGVPQQRALAVSWRSRRAWRQWWPSPPAACLPTTACQVCQCLGAIHVRISPSCTQWDEAPHHPCLAPIICCS